MNQFLPLPFVFLLSAIHVMGSSPLMAQQKNNPDRPNIIYILADDLGYGELGSYGQQKIKTPHLDELAKRGMKFSQHYSGSAVCACSRCVLLTGKHTGHAFIRSNREVGGWGPDEPEGQLPLLDEEVTLAELLKNRGYRTAAIGKWGLGGPGSTGHPCYQGFDKFYGYLCQRVAHNYYPTHLWDNHDVDVLGNPHFKAHQKIDEPPSDATGWQQYSGPVYATDRMIEHALKFIEENRDQPFFLYYATPIPHVAIQVPEDSLRPYLGQFEDSPYLGTNGYLPHPSPRAAYAGMISRMDRNVGKIISTVHNLGLDDNTLIIFSSDNGPTFNGGTDSAFFDSAGPLRGLKVSLHEGGIRVPMIAAWPGKIKPGSTTDMVSGFQDVLPTLTALTGAQTPDDIDGVSLLPTLLDTGQQQQHDYLYWELGNQQSVRSGPWKLYRNANKKGEIKTELYHLKNDLGETKNLVNDEPGQLQKMLGIAQAARVPSPEFPSPFDNDRPD
ncbi:MAG: arylsulfatase [Mariniblastus sp.]|nr:arylsulfatase [Mariniblastus sp.]